jgi:hypothetical protein
MGALVFLVCGVLGAACSSSKSESGGTTTDAGAGGAIGGNGATARGGASNSAGAGAMNSGGNQSGGNQSGGNQSGGMSSSGANSGGMSAGHGGDGPGLGGQAGEAGEGGMAGLAGSGGSSACGALAPASGDPKCCVAAGLATDLAIDDLEDGDGALLPIGNRQGQWFVFSDPETRPTQQPANGIFAATAGAGHACSLLPVPPACHGTIAGTLFSAATFATLQPANSELPTYAGLGFDFNNRLTKACPYDGHAYHGISFWAKGNTSFQALVKIPATTLGSASSSGTCVGTCEDHYGTVIVPAAGGTTWTQFTLTFTDSAHFHQTGWGTPAVFDPTTLLGMEFIFFGSTAATGPTSISFAIDDVAFIP